MKIIPLKNIRSNTDSAAKVYTTKYSPFTVTTHNSIITITHGGVVLAQKHIHMNLDDREEEYLVALHSAYRYAAVRLMMEDPSVVQALYRHILRHVFELSNDEFLDVIDPVNSYKQVLQNIMTLTVKANDIPMRAISWAECTGEDDEETEFEIVIRHDGDIFTSNGTDYQIEMVSELTGLPILGR